MARGGARVKSGPAKVPGSRTSDRAGYVPTALPFEGYVGPVPELTEFLPDPSPRELSLWAMYWRTPQACMWSIETWRWSAVVDLVVTRARADEPRSPATLWSSIKSLRDELGLSKAGLDHNGWAIKKDELAQKAAEKENEAEPAEPKSSSRSRMKSVKASGA